MNSPEQKEAIRKKWQNLTDLAWSMGGAATAISLALWLVADGPSVFLLASLGGSTVFLFALADAEAGCWGRTGQPFNITNEHLSYPPPSLRLSETSTGKVPSHLLS